LSKVTIKNIPSDSPEKKKYTVPLFYTYARSNELYVLIKDRANHSGEGKYTILSIDNGNIQAYSTYDSIDDFFKAKEGKEIVVVDVDIATKASR
jgi:hypothetical protein